MPCSALNDTVLGLRHRPCVFEAFVLRAGPESAGRTHSLSPLSCAGPLGSPSAEDEAGVSAHGADMAHRGLRDPNPRGLKGSEAPGQDPRAGGQSLGEMQVDPGPPGTVACPLPHARHRGCAHRTLPPPAGSARAAGRQLRASSPNHKPSSQRPEKESETPDAHRRRVRGGARRWGSVRSRESPRRLLHAPREALVLIDL